MKKLILCFFLVLLFVVNVSAEDVFTRQKQALDLDELERAGIDMEITQDISLDNGIKSLLNRVKEEISDVFTASFKTVGVIFAIAVLSTVLSGIYDAGLKAVPNYVTIAAVLAIFASVAGKIDSFINIGADTVDEMDAFSKILMPTLTAAVTVSGSPLGAAARYSASLMFSNFILSLIKNLLLPLVYTYIASACAAAMIKNSTVDKIADFINKITVSTLKIILTLFVTYITLTGFIASTGDEAGIKTVSTISNMIPVVGGILSNATGVVLAGAKIIKNSIGIFGILSVLSICLMPFLHLTVNYISFKLASVILAPVCDSKISELVGRIGTSFGAMLAICASSAFLLFISILSCMFAAGIA